MIFSLEILEKNYECILILWSRLRVGTGGRHL
jgi:hypothetical protein